MLKKLEYYEHFLIISENYNRLCVKTVQVHLKLK